MSFKLKGDPAPTEIGPLHSIQAIYVKLRFVCQKCGEIIDFYSVQPLENSVSYKCTEK